MQRGDRLAEIKHKHVSCVLSREEKIVRDKSLNLSSKVPHVKRIMAG